MRLGEFTTANLRFLDKSLDVAVAGVDPSFPKDLVAGSSLKLSDSSPIAPGEKRTLRIEATDAAWEIERLVRFLTNVGDEVTAGPDNPIRVEAGPGGEPRPYVHVRRGLEALIARPVFYELVEMAVERDTADGPALGERFDCLLPLHGRERIEQWKALGAAGEAQRPADGFAAGDHPHSALGLPAHRGVPHRHLVGVAEHLHHVVAGATEELFERRRAVLADK